MGVQDLGINGMPLAVTDAKVIKSIACPGYDCKDIIAMDKEGVIYLSKDVDWIQKLPSALLIFNVTKHIQFKYLADGDWDKYEKKKIQFEKQQEEVLDEYFVLLESAEGTKINYYEQIYRKDSKMGPNLGGSL